MTDSIYEAEYIVISDTTKEAVWLQKFISELEVAPSVDGLILLYYDNTGAVAQFKEPRAHHKSKHILRCFHLVREFVER